MDLEDLFGEIDYGVLGISLVLWALACCSLWFLPSMLNVIEYPLWIRIIGSIVMLPLSYLIVNMIGNR